jgi:hypothetical protein
MGTQNHARPGNRFVLQHISMVGYVVTDETGPWLTEPTPFRTVAERQRDAMQAESDRKAKRGPRPCLRCQKEFRSEGVHNRLCGRCRSMDESEQSVRPAIPARKFG